MTRIDLDSVKPVMQEIDTSIRELKSAQRIGGDSVLGYLNYSGLSSDYSIAVSGGHLRRFILTYTFSRASAGAVIDLFFYYSVGNADVMNNMVSPQTNIPDIYMFKQPLVPTPTSKQWSLTFKNLTGSPRTAYMKFIFSGTDTGSWTMTEV